MNTAHRVRQQPAYLLHQRPFRDTSLLIDVFSREHGKLALVARGARSQKSRLKPLLRPFMPLRLSWVQRTDLGTLTGAELDGQPLSLTGDALLSGYYVNELILHLLHRHDAQPEVFAAYSQAIGLLASAADPAPALRSFEIELLRLLGYAVNFEFEAVTHDDIDPSAFYEYRAEQGPVRVARDEGAMVFSGEVLIAMRDHRIAEPEALLAASRLLRGVIAHHLDGRELKSRKVLVDLHRSRAKMSGRNHGNTV
ncbi:MAG: DNA repair protein RecO [Woeseiaceae bacterium]